MAYAPPTEIGRTPHAPLVALIAECAAFFQLLRTAQRVASAIEHRRQPDLEDLSRLGIKAPLPKHL